MGNSLRATSPYYSLENIERLLNINRIRLRKIAKNSGSFYLIYDLKDKKTGKWRHITNPKGELKRIQKKIYTSILKKHMLLLPEGIIGGVAGKSIKSNATPHLQQEMVVTLDIKDCFPKTTSAKILGVWIKKIGCGRRIAELFTKLTTLHRQLPQGAPTSSALCNLCLLPLFNEIKDYTQNNAISFTLYVDDITLSGTQKNVLSSISPIIKIIQKHGYSVSDNRKKKIRKMPMNKLQKITGIVVNKKTSLTHQELQDFRFMICQIGRKRKITNSEYQHITGKIQFIKSISEEKGEKLLELANMLLPKEISPVKETEEIITRKCRHHKNFT